MAYQAKPKPPEIILNSKSDLSKLNKTLAGCQEELINIVLKCARTSEDPKMQLEAAKFLIDKRVAVSDAIAKESIQKILLSQKLSGGNNQQSIANNSQPRAVLSMSIQRTEGVDYSELDEENNEFDLRSVGSFEQN